MGLFFRKLPAPIPFPARPLPMARASLRQTITCRLCGRPMRLQRIVPLFPSGVRGYYSDFCGHTAAIQRDGVTRTLRSTAQHVYFA